MAVSLAMIAASWPSANSRLLMSARFFSPVSPAKNGRLWPVHFREVDTWLLEVHFLVQYQEQALCTFSPILGDGRLSKHPWIVHTQTRHEKIA